MTTKILLIEDEVCLRQSLLIMLTAEGYEVLDAENGWVGVDLARLETPDVVICDLRMSHLNGDEVLDILSHDPQTEQIPIIFISADELSVIPEEIKSLGHDHFLQKPFSRNDLLEAIAHNEHPSATGQFHNTHATKIQTQHCPC